MSFHGGISRRLLLVCKKNSLSRQAPTILSQSIRFQLYRGCRSNGVYNHLKVWNILFRHRNTLVSLLFLTSENGLIYLLLLMVIIIGVCFNITKTPIPFTTPRRSFKPYLFTVFVFAEQINIFSECAIFYFF